MADGFWKSLPSTIQGCDDQLRSRGRRLRKSLPSNPSFWDDIVLALPSSSSTLNDEMLVPRSFTDHVIMIRVQLIRAGRYRTSRRPFADFVIAVRRCKSQWCFPFSFLVEDPPPPVLAGGIPPIRIGHETFGDVVKSNNSRRGVGGRLQDGVSGELVVKSLAVSQ